MYRVVMVPLDGSAFSEHALPLALGIARRAGASVRLVHVCEPPALSCFTDGMSIVEEPSQALNQEQATNYLTQLAMCLSIHWKVPITTMVLEGPAADVLRTHVRTSGVDLVVMTTHAHGRLPRAWLGSVADALMHSLPLPIVLVRPVTRALDLLELAPEPALRHVLIPLDGSALAEEILAHAVDLGSVMQAEYTLLQAIDLQPTSYAPAMRLIGADEQVLAQWQAEVQGYLDQVADRLRAQGQSVRTSIMIAPPAVAILDYVRQHAVDLIAMATHGRGGLMRMVVGSVADVVLRSTDLPVLLYRPLASVAVDAANVAARTQTIDIEE
jgi:nucleotide-binding universal stress UspA family protein